MMYCSSAAKQLQGLLGEQTAKSSQAALAFGQLASLTNFWYRP
jgi:hypothetical protein